MPLGQLGVLKQPSAADQGQEEEQSLMGQTCEQHHLQPEPTPRTCQPKQPHSYQPKTSSSDLSQVASASQSHAYAGGKAAQHPPKISSHPICSLGARLKRGQRERGSTAGIATRLQTRTSASRSIFAEYPSRLARRSSGDALDPKRRLLCESGSFCDN